MKLSKVDRKGFIKLSSTGVAALTAALGLPVSCSATNEGPAFNIESLQLFEEGDIRILWAIFDRLLGRGSIVALIGENGYKKVFENTILMFDNYIVEVTKDVPGVDSDFKSALTLFEYAPMVLDFRFSRFTGLSPEEQDKTIEDWMNSDWQLKKDVFMALKGLITMTFYAQPEIIKAIGYDVPPFSAGIHPSAITG